MKKKEPIVVGHETVVEPAIYKLSEKDELLALYAKLKELNVRSISDLENLIARAE